MRRNADPSSWRHVSSFYGVAPISPMLLFAIALLSIGGFVALLSVLWTLALAFQRHTYWGLTVLLIPVGGGVAFSLARWREARAPFCVGLFSLSLVGTALFAMPQGSLHVPSMLRKVLHLSHSSTALDEQRMEAVRQEADRHLHLWSLKRQEDALLARKELLLTNQPQEAKALAQEIRRYNAQVQHAVRERAGARFVSR